MKTSKKVILFSSIFATIGLIGTTSVLLSSCGETTSVDTPPVPQIYQMFHQILVIMGV